MPRKQNFTFLSLVAYCGHDVDVIVTDKAVEHYAFIQHQPEGDKKVPHYHIVLKLNTQVTADYFISKKAFTENVRCVGLVKRSGAFTAFEYLIHKNDADKIQYSWNEVKSDDLNWWLKLAGIDRAQDNVEFLADLATLSVLKMAQKYGRDFIKNVDKYLVFRNRFLERPIRDIDYDVDCPFNDVSDNVWGD